MKVGAKSAAWLLPFLLTGCFHRKPQIAQSQPLPPPIEDTASTKPEPAPANVNPPVPTISEQPQQQQQISPPPEPVKRPPKHRRPANTNTQMASVGPPPAVPAAGNLGTGDPTNLRQQTDASIEQTEKTLNGITRKLNDQEQKTAAQIREFIKQAREELTTGDINGAHTLAEKAKVFLDELHP
jgi:hypothetical protein